MNSTKMQTDIITLEDSELIVIPSEIKRKRLKIDLKPYFMKNILIIAYILISCIGIYGQAIKVEYNYHFYTVRGYETHRPMILMSSNDRSKFYNPSTNRIDSMCDSPEKKAAFDAYVNSRAWDKDLAYPVRWEKMYVEKDRKESSMSVYDTVAGEERFYYQEPLADILWEIKDSTDVILGYECVLAKCDYHGRHWTAWFTPEIPISDGPWKLNGLPGLILRAAENSGQYEFNAVGIENFEGEIEPVYQKFLYEMVERKDLLKTKRLIDENMGGFISARTGIELPKNMKSLQTYTKLDYLETDY